MRLLCGSGNYTLAERGTRSTFIDLLAANFAVVPVTGDRIKWEPATKRCIYFWRFRALFPRHVRAVETGAGDANIIVV